jgi:hypothetical protein
MAIFPGKLAKFKRICHLLRQFHGTTLLIEAVPKLQLLEQAQVIPKSGILELPQLQNLFLEKKKMTKKLCLLFLTCLAAAAILTACGAGDAKSGAQGGKELVFMTNLGANENTALYKNTRKFMQEHPEVKVTLNTVSGNDILNTFTTAAMAGSGPDIVSLDSSGWVIDAAAMSTLSP